MKKKHARLCPLHLELRRWLRLARFARYLELALPEAIVSAQRCMLHDVGLEGPAEEQLAAHRRLPLFLRLEEEMKTTEDEDCVADYYDDRLVREHLGWSAPPDPACRGCHGQLQPPAP